jgi:hypothetical protein
MPLPVRQRRPPEFVGVGAEATGGGWWLEALSAHPAIEAPPQHSLDFFGEFCDRRIQRSDVATYRRLLPRARSGVVRGEWTDRYMADAWTPALLARVAPGARLLVMLRDPLEVFREVMAERLVTQDTSRRWRMTDVANRSCHAPQLRRLQRYFAPERILVLQFERCLGDPSGQYRRTLRFLGVDEAAAPADLPTPAAPAYGRADLWPDMDGALHSVMDGDVRALAEMEPELDLALWPNFAHLA